jgi:hypothetical protein
VALIEEFTTSIEITSPTPLNNCSSSTSHPTISHLMSTPFIYPTVVTQPIAVITHHATPTTSTPTQDHTSTTQQLVLGADTLCPIPCTVPSTLGPGEQLFSTSRESQTCPFWATARLVEDFSFYEATFRAMIILKVYVRSQPFLCSTKELSAV